MKTHNDRFAVRFLLEISSLHFQGRWWQGRRVLYLVQEKQDLLVAGLCYLEHTRTDMDMLELKESIYYKHCCVYMFKKYYFEIYWLLNNMSFVSSISDIILHICSLEKYSIIFYQFQRLKLDQH